MWPWLAIAGLAAVGELLSYDLFLAPVVVAALVVALVAPVTPVPLEVALFGVLSLVGIMFLRPIVRHALGLDSGTGDTEPVGHANVVGRRAIVTQTVNAESGQIRIGEGEFWTARPFESTHTFPRDDAVEVLLVDGVTALVESVPTATPPHTFESPVSIEKGIES